MVRARPVPDVVFRLRMLMGIPPDKGAYRLFSGLVNPLIAVYRGPHWADADNRVLVHGSDQHDYLPAVFDIAIGKRFSPE